MNEVIKQLKNRRSVREFTGEKVKEEDLKLILETAQRYPNSNHAQQTSLIVIRDRETIKKIAELSGGQKQIETADVFILILIDYYRGGYAANSIGNKHFGPKSADGILVGAVDAGIMLATIQTAAEALGYGTTAIGGLRLNPEILTEMFNLPEYVFPILGTTIGVPQENKLKSSKPRVPFESFAFDDGYDTEKVKKGVDKFQEIYEEWKDKNNLNSLPSYKENVSNAYKQIRYNKTKSVMEKQGFEFTDDEK
ncbi:MAG: nitroreductase family protein [Leptotrichiaceae bacterium]|nr:nitroreductase family protein [Leptotrichiaceae bacterium]